eukprot:TRINITY_DN705_c0_g1_i27.p1 TRINITY_DN705_c0_g1~~TRINITY_DN705_c0_g1_i27.p1  ORF type:complete len:269 (+),score=23.98 TRINITY_DN705_c0_g1_i27:72-878(+)
MATNEVQFPGSVFRMRYNYIHDALGGNNVKSRAERNEIYFNWIEGAMYHELELIGPDPAGGVSENQAREDSDVVGNVLKKVGTSFVARLGGDGTGQSKGRYRFVSNTILMNTGGGAAFRLFDGIQSFEAHNNIVYSPSTNSVIIRTAEAVWTNGVQISGTNNWVRTGYLNTADGRSTINGWTNTVIGTSPGFVNLASNDLRLAAGSSCIHAGNPGPFPVIPYPYLYSLPSPFYFPKRIAQPIGSAEARCGTGNPPIGAFLASSDPPCP